MCFLENPVSGWACPRYHGSDLLCGRRWMSKLKMFSCSVILKKRERERNKKRMGVMHLAHISFERFSYLKYLSVGSISQWFHKWKGYCLIRFQEPWCLNSITHFIPHSLCRPPTWAGHFPFHWMACYLLSGDRMGWIFRRFGWEVIRF